MVLLYHRVGGLSTPFLLNSVRKFALNGSNSLGAVAGVDGAIVFASAQVKHKGVAIALGNHTHTSLNQEGIAHTQGAQGNHSIVAIRVNLNHLIISFLSWIVFIISWVVGFVNPFLC
jgi:hypothetical protein